MSKKLLFKGGHATSMIPYEIEDFSSLYMRDARVDEKTKAYIDSVIGNSVLNLCPYRNVLVTHKYDTVEGNVVTLNDCQDDEIIQLSEVQGNTMVNCCKDGSKELILNGDIDTSGYNNVTLTEGVDGGLVDVALEGNTMVNVCDQEEPVAITKNYEVSTGNHIALQGEYDGKCRPNIYGNTLWVDNDTEEILTTFDGTKSLRLQSSFEDKLITDEKDAHSGKYKVDYKVTGKNKCRIKDGNYTNTSAGLTYTIRDNQIQINGTSTGMSSLGMSMCYPNFINGKTYMTSTSNSNVTLYISYIDNGTRKYSGGGNKTYTHNPNYTDIMCYLQINNSEVTFNNEIIKCQIEEGTKTTTYEPYKEYTKTLYLNSPLLEGDTIEQSGNNIIHVHRYNKVVLDGSNYVPIREKIMATSGNYRWTFVIPNVKNSIDANTGLGICDKYPIVTPNDTWNSIKGITQNNSSNKIVLYLDKYKDGSDTSKQALIKELSNNPVTFVYELATPTPEIISTNDNLLLDSYVNGHLDVDTVVPTDKVVFQSYGTSLKYLSPNTEYIIQFESDNVGKLEYLYMDGALLSNINVVKGLNKITCTTLDKGYKNLDINGIGFNMSKIVVTPKVEQPFGYFKGMKSVGECEGNVVEVVSNNKDNTLSNKQTITHEPLRGLPNGVKDKYVIIDGKWYIERNTIQLIMDSTFIQDKTLHHYISQDYPDVIGFSTPNNWFKWNSSLVCANLVYDGHRNINAGSLISNQEKIFVHDYIFITLNKNKVSTLNEAGFREYLKNNPITLVGQNTAPTYEPIDYNPFEVYTDITHISNNSIIPCNMVIKNTGYNTIIKPNTLYTVALDINKNGTIGMDLGGAKVTTTNNVATITTPATLSDDSLRVYGKGIKGSKVRLLEGDIINIPKHFTGMQSSFEDKVQTDGSYKVEVLSNNENLFRLEDIKYSTSPGNSARPIKNGFKIITDTVSYWYVIVSMELNVKPKTTYTLGVSKKVVINAYPSQEPIWGVGYVFIREYGDKILTEGKVKDNTRTYFRFNSGENTKIRVIFTNATDVTTQKGEYDFTDLDLRESKSNLEYVDNKYNKIQFLLNEPLRGVGDIKDKVYVKEDKVVVERNCGIRAYKDGDFGTYLTDKVNTVYQLATPVYEEVECDLSKLALEGYENGTLFYDTNIPVTTQFYDFNVNIKDMLIPNETYCITFNADRVKDITINLSGVQVKYKTSMGYNKVPIQLGDVVNTNFSMDSRGVELNDLMISTSTSLIYVKDMNDVCIYDEVNNKYSITITSTGGKESDKRVILLDYPLLRLNKDVYDRLYYSNKDSRYRIDKKVFKHKFTNDYEYSKYAAETNDTYYSSFISLNEAIKDYVVITNEKVKTVKVEDDKYYFKIKWSDLGVSDKTEANGKQGVKDFFNNNEVYLYYATDGFVEIVDGLTRQTLKVYQPETFMKFLGNTTTTVTILIPMKNV
jgi:hypothetical protein